jgi:hypothetical protein
MDGQGARSAVTRVDHLELARPNHEELEAAVADVEEDLPGPVALEARVGTVAELRDLGVGQRRERGALQVVCRHLLLSPGGRC